MAHGLRLVGLTKRFKRHVAVDNLDLEVVDGQFYTLLGPSGCGKTTTLRLIAGLEQADAGSIYLDERLISSPEKGIFLEPEERGMGMVFQSYAVRPHMTVAQNVGYPLSARRVAAREIQARVSAALELVGLAGLEDRPATKLSGGQQQRVTLARQSEAMAIADELIVMNGGRIEQRANARTLYERPATAFVADFIGAASFFDGVLTTGADARGLASLRVPASPEVTLRGRLSGAGQAGQRYAAMVRPEAISVGPGPAEGDLNRVPSRVLGVQYLGDHLEVRASALGAEARLRLPPRASLVAGEAVELTFEAADCPLIPASATVAQ